jgi:hypothetical protein
MTEDGRGENKNGWWERGIRKKKGGKKRKLCNNRESHGLRTPSRFELGAVAAE